MESFWLLFVINFLILHTAFLCAQQIDIPLTVEGYTGDDVVLPCRLENPGGVRVTQMQWSYDTNGSIPIIVYLPPSDVSIPESHLKGRFHLKNSSKDDYDVVIREVVITDGGRYTCSIATFPDGNIKGSTQLQVLPQDQKPLDSNSTLIGAVTTVSVSVLIIIIGVYLVISRKRKTTLLNHMVPSDEGRTEVVKNGTAKKEEDLVYSHVAFNQPTRSGNDTVISNEKPAEEKEVTYAQVTLASRKENEDRDATV